MPSRADLRVAVERGLRLAGAGALTAACLLAFLARGGHPVTRAVTPAGLRDLLAEVAADADSIALSADTALDPVSRDWLAAARRAGRAVRWNGSPPATAIAVEPLADPAGGDRVLVAAPQGRIRLTDTAGAVDSVVAAGGGASFLLPRLAGSAAALAGSQWARAPRRDSLAQRRIVVIGRPSWETKFVVAALEERGWGVDARIPLSPDTAVVQGSPAGLDTARVAAVVALDDAAVREAPAIAAFVLEGGGLVLGPAAAGDRAFAPLRAGGVGARQPAPVLEVRAGDPRRALSLVPVAGLAPDAVPLERRDGAIAVAARRVGAGRVLQMGYEDTWRWRMSGPEGALQAHRRWWAALVASVAYRPTLGVAPGVPSHDAPLARMVARLGPPDPALRHGLPPGRGPGGGPRWWLLALGLGALLAEWGSRRLRGAP